MFFLFSSFFLSFLSSVVLLVSVSRVVASGVMQLARFCMSILVSCTMASTAPVVMIILGVDVPRIP